jgi:hypothetical protein
MNIVKAETLIEKDCPENALVFMYESFMRHTENHIIINHIKTCIQHIQLLRDINQQNIYVEYLVVLMFELRNCRGGKGYRNIFIQMWNTIYEYYPKQMDSFISFIPHYGTWRDINTLIITGTEQLRLRLYDFIVDGLRKDITILNNGSTNELSFAAKWCPKEGSAADKKCNASRHIAQRLYPELYAENFTMALRKYRQEVSRLNKALHTTEVLMCNKQFSKINFNEVPKKALIKYNHAFLNVSIMDETETRHPDDEDRKECRIHYEQYLNGFNRVKNEIKNKPYNTLLLNEIIDRIQIISNDVEITELESIWNLYMNSHNYTLSRGMLFTTVQDEHNISTSLALAIASQQTVPAYKNRCITCAKEAAFIEIPTNGSLLDKIKYITKNIIPNDSFELESTMRLILTQARIYRLSPENIPKWCLFISSKYNESFHINTILLEQLTSEYEKTGIEICGKPYTIPEIIVWNISNNNKQYPVVHYELGYKLIHGFSQVLFKEVIYDISKVQSITPWTNLKFILDDYEYEPLRVAIRQQFKLVDDDTEVISPKTSNSPPPTKDTSSIINYLRSFF